MKRLLAVTLLTGLVILASPPVARAGFIVNGDFLASPNPLDQWTTDPGSVSPTASGGVVHFAEDAAFDPTQIVQTFTLPDNATRLRFEYRLFTSSVTGKP